jgi:hypothetical protein
MFALSHPQKGNASHDVLRRWQFETARGRRSEFKTVSRVLSYLGRKISVESVTRPERCVVIFQNLGDIVISNRSPTQSVPT